MSEPTLIARRNAFARETTMKKKKKKILMTHYPPYTFCVYPFNLLRMLYDSHCHYCECSSTQQYFHNSSILIRLMDIYLSSSLFCYFFRMQHSNFFFYFSTILLMCVTFCYGELSVIREKESQNERTQYASCVTEGTKGRAGEREKQCARVLWLSCVCALQAPESGRRTAVKTMCVHSWQTECRYCRLRVGLPVA